MTDKTREAFDAWWDEADSSALRWSAWQAATLAERERCALVCVGLALASEPDDFALDALEKAATAIRLGGDT